MKKKILICLEQLGIGGVETAVLNQITVYRKRGYDVLVLAKDGVYRKTIEKMGVKYLEFHYLLENQYGMDSYDSLISMIKSEKITEVHIHQYPCYLYLVPVCLTLQIPFITYIHSSVAGTFEWFEKTYPVYQPLFQLTFEKASAIVCITDEIKKEHQKLFQIEGKKYRVLPNSLDFSYYHTEKEIGSFRDKLLYIGRFSEEKRKSIEKSIELFFEIYHQNSNVSLDIIGDGPLKTELEVKYREYKDNIRFLGATTDVATVMDNYGIVMGMDRCMLEALSLKKIAILCSYDGKATFIEEQNIEAISKENFSGHHIEDYKKLATKLMSLDEEQCSKMVNKNYRFVKKHFDIERNVFDEDITWKYYPLSCLYFEKENKINQIMKQLQQEANEWYNKYQLTMSELEIAYHFISKIRLTWLWKWYQKKFNQKHK